jgi:hypothetical protein
MLFFGGVLEKEMNTEERFVVKQIVGRALDKGYLLSVDDGEDFPIQNSDDLEAVMAGLGHCDDEWLIVSNADGKRIGAIYFVYGNDADEVVADCTDKPEILELL